MRRHLAKTWVLGALALTLAAVALHQGWQWRAIARYNAALAAGDYARAGSGGDAFGRLARAYVHQGANRWSLALAGYLALENHPQVGDTARFNAATLKLQRALALLEEDEAPERAFTWGELAKGDYRRLLRRNPDHWRAKLNLELALRRFPDPKAPPVADGSPPAHDARAVMARQAEARGLP
ncbi:MAG: hypothetical protein ACFCBW_14335 [Candidatus Competibacterales bacterium]